LKVLLLDNIDSFTWNLAQQIQMLGASCKVVRSDEASLVDIEKYKPTHIVLSPGPHRPEDATLSLKVIKTFAGRVPILGVCLGHQCLSIAFGSRHSVCHAREPMHGKTSKIFHTSRSVFRGIPSPFLGARYHSLVVREVPENFEPLAWTGSQHRPNVLMAMAHVSMPLIGIQFHPESFLTEHGDDMMKRFLDLSCQP
jgi:anthranilate synthase/aminodeoxychorismate synthase-like glutamine amidotransferase